MKVNPKPMSNILGNESCMRAAFMACSRQDQRRME